jgi:hypothetical protein
MYVPSHPLYQVVHAPSGHRAVQTKPGIRFTLVLVDNPVSFRR